MKKNHILEEIRRTAAANGGTPLGKGRFLKETGIKPTDWEGRFWSRWGDALKETGFSPNKLNSAWPEDTLLESLVAFCRELGRLPVHAELKLKRRSDPTFPSANTFNRFGAKPQLVQRLADYCRKRADLADVLAMCLAQTETPSENEETESDEPAIGFVYLFKSGRHYKIGKSNAAGRREREVALQLPEKTTAVHTIRTDDPAGIEAYWHSRFEQKRLNGEWFKLTADDVRAFKRRRFM